MSVRGKEIGENTPTGCKLSEAASRQLQLRHEYLLRGMQLYSLLAPAGCSVTKDVPVTAAVAAAKALYITVESRTEEDYTQL
jgi:hypothetical protein